MVAERRSILVLFAIVTAGILTVGAWSTAALAQTDQPQRGGVLRVAVIGEAPSLDAHWTTAAITQQITWHIYEGLYAFDAKFQAIPHLAEGHEALDGGRRYVIRLRRGVRFHHGKEMTAADVVASLVRWGKLTPAGKAIFKAVDAIEAKDAATVEVRFREPSGVLLVGLADPNALGVIYPKEVIEAAGEGQVKQFIGTGPFKFVEHRPDRHIRLARFDGYVARPEAPNGYGGRRTAHVDEMLFIPVPDTAVRLAGVQTGEYHFAERIKPDQYERIQAMPGVDSLVTRPFNWAMAVFNKKAGLFTDRRLRQAFLAALDMEPIIQRRNKPELYDVFSTGAQMVPEPSLGGVIQCNWPGWWCHPVKDALLQAMMREPDFKTRYALWEKVQALFFWNAWLEKR